MTDIWPTTPGAEYSSRCALFLDNARWLFTICHYLILFRVEVPLWTSTSILELEGAWAMNQCRKDLHKPRTSLMLVGKRQRIFSKSWKTLRNRTSDDSQWAAKYPWANKIRLKIRLRKSQGKVSKSMTLFFLTNIFFPFSLQCQWEFIAYRLRWYLQKRPNIWPSDHPQWVRLWYKYFKFCRNRSWSIKW